MKKVLIIVPAYNESEVIVQVVENLISTVTGKNEMIDYVIIDDGSIDNTYQKCKDNGFNIVSLPVNLGLSSAFRTGMKYAHKNGYDYAIQFDADGQHSADFINSLVEAAENNNSDIVIGSRYIFDKRKWSAREIGSRIISFCVWLTTGKKIYDPTSGMRLYNTKMIKRFAKYTNYYPEPDTVAYLIRCGAKVDECPVQISERKAGESYLNFGRSTRYMFNVVTSILLMQWFRRRDMF